MVSELPKRILTKRLPPITRLAVGSLTVGPLQANLPVERAGELKTQPIWAFHGVDDGTVAVTESISMANAVRACGGSIKLTLLPGVNHNAWEPAMYEEGAIEWLLTHRRGEK